MNCQPRHHHVRHIGIVLAGFAGSILVVLSGATAAFAYPVPASGGPAGSVQPVQTIVTGGMPGWQIALIAIGAALFAAALAVTLDHARIAHRHVTAPGA